LLALAALPAVAALVQPRRLQGACTFVNEPTLPYFWDPSCTEIGDSLGCLADGIHEECRFCGIGAYSEVFCPADWCEFDNEPHIPFFWDSRCANGLIGCLADGRNMECRFCGEYPYNGTVVCPDNEHVHIPTEICEFDNEPTTPYFWDASCENGMLGCNADGEHMNCRFCGAGAYAEVNCPASLCTFPPLLLPPSAPYRYYWEPKCGGSEPEASLGCLADGIHPECRYCGANEYESVTCPAWAS
jgi:ribosomal protein L37E